MNSRLILRRLSFMAAGLAGSLVFVELALRIFHLAPAAGIGTVTAGQFARLPGIYTPHQHVRDLQRPALPFTVSIDSLGFRGGDFARAKPAGQWRIIMLGDSYVYGDFVDDSVTFPAQLEQRLRRACGDALVINAGLGGTTIIDHQEMLRRSWVLQPDLAIVVFVADDFDNLNDPISSWQHLESNRERKSRFPLSIIYPWARHTALWNLLVKARATRENRADAIALQQRYAGSRTATSQHLRDKYGELLLAMRDSLKSRQIDLVLTIFPWSRELQGLSDDGRWLGQFAAQHGIRAVSPLPALQASGLGETMLYLLPEDGHPSRIGYRIVADTLAAYLLAAPDAPASCKP